MCARGGLQDRDKSGAMIERFEVERFENLKREKERWTMEIVRSILRVMSGVDFVVDDQGRKKSVIIDLEKHGELWEDIYDAMVVRSRKEEPRETLAQVEKKLKTSRGG